MKYKDTSSDWLFFAESDLKTAQVMLEEKVYHMTCFHSQQTIEKCLKAILRYKQKTVYKTHSLSKLFYEISKLKIKNLPDKKSVIFVDQFYSPTRYPDTLPGSLPESLPNKNDAKKALKIAKNFYESTQALIQTQPDETK